ncbi:MAG: hypothetical protein KKB02_17735 [Alphaproteobacteria bacterium]|nr:hypothetical protein [Alphaproteobacteria bacterium]
MPRVTRLALVACLSLSGAAHADPARTEGPAATLPQVLRVLKAAPQAAGGCSRPLRRAPLLCRADVASTQMASSRL